TPDGVTGGDSGPGEQLGGYEFGLFANAARHRCLVFMWFRGGRLVSGMRGPVGRGWWSVAGGPVVWACGRWAGGVGVWPVGRGCGRVASSWGHARPQVMRSCTSPIYLACILDTRCGRPPNRSFKPALRYGSVHGFLSARRLDRAGSGGEARGSGEKSALRLERAR